MVGMTSTAFRSAAPPATGEPAAGPACQDVWAQVLAARAPMVRVLGAPGTGKSTLAVHLVLDRVRRGELRAEQCLILAASRRSAALVRDRITRALAETTREPLARTIPSLAFGILRRCAIRDDLPTPFLLGGAEQDAVLRELLAGHRDDPHTAPNWPDSVRDALPTTAFRSQLRDLLMRAVEHGVDAPTLARLGHESGRPQWVAAAQVLQEYDQVTALSRPGAFDPAWLVTAACDALQADPELASEIAEQIRLVVVDDAQEVGAPGARLIGLLADSGARIVLIGDPDSAVQAFRGADPAFLAHGYRSIAAGPEFALTQGHRMPAEVSAAAARAASLIGALGGGMQRRAAPAGRPGSVGVQVFRSAAQEATFIADSLRRAHLIDGVPWSELAVIVRGQGRSDVVRRVLSAAHVPVAAAESEIPLKDEDAVRPLLALVRAAHERVEHRRAATPAALAQDPDAGWRLSPQVAIDLLTSPYAGADAVTLRRLRRALRRPELDRGGSEPADLLVARALARPADLADLGIEATGARRVARMLAAATAAAHEGPPCAPGDRRSSPPAVEEIIWAAWDAAAIADDWRARALTGGRGGTRADRDLDAVIAVLAAAADFSQKLPGIGASAFTDHLQGQDVAADSIVDRGVDQERVAVLTPHAAAGRSWRRVFVAGVQEGTWPDLRLRGSLLGSEDLVDLLAGRERTIRTAQAAIRHDEARLFYVALSRASESLQVSAVQDEQDQPSSYLEVIDPRTEPRQSTEIETPLTLVGLVSAMRRDVAAPVDDSPSRVRRAVAARTLARLAEAGVRGAHPGTWWALREVSGTEPRIPEEAMVPISPSALHGFDQCQLRWLLGSSGGDGPAIGSAALGTLVHEVIAGGDDDEAMVMDRRLEASWSRLGLPAGWINRARRADAAAMLARAEAYFAHAQRAGWHRVAAETAFEAEFGRARVRGVVDRIERHEDGRIRVIDYKTGSSKPAAAELARHPQLGVYQAAVEAGAFAAGHDSGGAALVHLGKAATTKAETSVQHQAPLGEDPDPGWAEAVVAGAAEAMAGSRFVATIGAACRVCPLTTSCPARAEGVMLA